MFFRGSSSNKNTIDKNNKNIEIESYFEKLPNPSLNRNGDRYYVEIQLLAFKLMRYLKMNNYNEEHSCQGNYNWTYFKENLSDEDWGFLVKKILGSMNTHDWEDAINYWKNNREDQEKFLHLVKSDVEDTLMRIVYKTKNNQEVSYIVQKKDLGEAVGDIYSRVDVEYLETSEYVN